MPTKMGVERVVLMSDSITATAEYNELLDSIKRTLAAGQLRAARAVNNVLVETYWQIGRDIVARQQRAGLGCQGDRAPVRGPADGAPGHARTVGPEPALHGGARLPMANRNCAAALLPNCPGATSMVILDSCPDRETSEFYAQRAVAGGLDPGRAADDDRQPTARADAARAHHLRPALPEADREAVREIVKDPFILDFLAADPVRERDLSKALTDNLTRFLRELGTGFAFVGAEVPVPCGDREFFVDLLFYHCRLHRYVVFELKLGRFEPEYVGKLNFYVQLVDDHLRDQARDDPTLGMLLVVGRDDVTVEVALRGVSTPLAVTEWRRLPAKVRQALPTAEDLRPTVTRTVREIESTTPVALCRPEGAASSSSVPVPSSSWTRQRGRAR